MERQSRILHELQCDRIQTDGTRNDRGDGKRNNAIGTISMHSTPQLSTLPPTILIYKARRLTDSQTHRGTLPRTIDAICSTKRVTQVSE